MKRALFVGFLLIAAGVLGYGYWHNDTHGSVYFNVVDVSDREHARFVNQVDLAFFDSSGKMLAQAQGMESWGAIFITSPESYACREIEQRASRDSQAASEWAICFERQSRWLPTWVRDVR